jgi:fructose-1,6-bisphosphatase/inositol monophosphatase family enzyme
VGEEAVSANPALLGLLGEPGYHWVIDPIDGTASFAAGCALFACMVALVKDGDAVAGWILDPPTGRLFLAETGSGAVLREPDGERIRLRTANPPSLAHIAGVANFRMKDRDLAARLAYRLDRTAGVLNMRCSGQEYPAMALGQIHYGLYGRGIPWDHAPGALILTEAGRRGAPAQRHAVSGLRSAHGQYRPRRRPALGQPDPGGLWRGAVAMAETGPSGPLIRA